MFFVREDLDTRIYFNQLEDAIGYMGRRGYAKMRPEEEEEWRGTLEKAHKVVKVNVKNIKIVVVVIFLRGFAGVWSCM